jgi:hypothetical protein
MAEDPELERELAAMFASARPRPGFDDELWARIAARRPWRHRLADLFRPAVRAAPAVAGVLAVLVGAGWLLAHARLGGGTATSSSTGGAAYGRPQSAATAFGVLPSVVSAARDSSGSKAVSPPPGTAAADAGPAVVFSGVLPDLPGVLPVYRYDEPTAAQREQAAAALGARSGFKVAVSPSDVAAGVEPRFAISGIAEGAASPDDFLARHGLMPNYLHLVGIDPARGGIVYARQFPTPTGSAPEVGRDGLPTGLQVGLQGALVVGVTGPIDLPLTSADYPARAATEALAAAGATAVPTAGPTAFDSAELVYLLVVAGGHGYYEPELLLTGRGGALLAPLVAPAWLAR